MDLFKESVRSERRQRREPRIVDVRQIITIVRHTSTLAIRPDVAEWLVDPNEFAMTDQMTAPEREVAPIRQMVTDDLARNR